jgi:hypothetical protein
MYLGMILDDFSVNTDCMAFFHCDPSDFARLALFSLTGI